MSGSGDDGVSESFIRGVIREFLPTRAYNAKTFIRVVRGLIFIPLVGGILSIARPFIDGILVLFRGSQPGANAATDPYWGIADLIDYVATTLLDTVRLVIESYFQIIMMIPRAAVGADPGPFMGLLGTAIVVGEIVVTLELLRRVLIERVIPAAAALVNLDSVTRLISGGNG